MSIEYTIIPGNGGGPDGRGAWMTHVDRRQRYDPAECDGCGKALPRYVAIITDRSGSEYAVSHDSSECITGTVATLEGLDPELVGER